MLEKTMKLTETSRNGYIEIEGGEPTDLTGTHEAEVSYLEPKESAKNTRYLAVGARISSGPGLGSTIFGRVFRGRSQDQFIRALGLDPSTLGNQLAGDQVIGKKILITVEGQETKKGSEQHWKISTFAPLT